MDTDAGNRNCENECEIIQPKKKPIKTFQNKNMEIKRSNREVAYKRNDTVVALRSSGRLIQPLRARKPKAASAKGICPALWDN